MTLTLTELIAILAAQRMTIRFFGLFAALIATLLMDLLRREMPDADVATFRFKAVRPTFDPHPLRVHGTLQPDGKTVRLWAQDHEGWLTMDATATLR